jgi:hypothetical protein
MIEVRLFSPGRKYVRFFAAVLAVNLAGVARVAAAQTPPPPDKPQSQIPEKMAPPLENGAKDNKLQMENGVIKPPANVDPGMAEKPPDTGGRMPVIPLPELLAAIRLFIPNERCPKMSRLSEGEQPTAVQTHQIDWK